MTIGLIGKKIGMTREFFDSGVSVPVTVLLVEKGRILDVITKDKRGYDAIRVGFGKIKNSKLTKQMKGVFAKKSTEAKRFLKEFRVNNISDYKEGNEIGLELFKDHKFVDVTSKTIGKGFAGSMKRHNFSGLRAYTVFRYHIELMVLLVKIKIQERFLKERKWLVIWVTKLELYKISR